MNLNSEQLNRYARQIIIKDIGTEGQQKLIESKVLVVGAGGLGSPCIMYLASAGVGTIGIADGDRVDITNLQRQVIHKADNVGMSKPQSAKEFINSLNCDVNAVIYNEFLTDLNILDIIKEYDFIVDCSDRLQNKFLVNDACVISEKPFCHAGVIKFSGQIMTYIPHESPCYRCIFEDIPEDENTAQQNGIIGMTAGIIGAMQAMEAVKYLTGAGNLLTGRMVIFDGLNMSFRTAEFKKPSEYCRVCGKNADIKSLSWYEKYRK
jgi:molybdopterin/thiamine biosynthesis adenylyltransferase